LVAGGHGVDDHGIVGINAEDADLKQITVSARRASLTRYLVRRCLSRNLVEMLNLATLRRDNPKRR
jgi:hypothetical protein